MELNEFSSKFQKKPAENIRSHSFTYYFGKIPDFSNKPLRKTLQNLPIIKPDSDSEFLKNILESQKQAILNKEALRTRLISECGEEIENNENYYFDKNELASDRKKKIFDFDLEKKTFSLNLKQAFNGIYYKNDLKSYRNYI